MNTINDVLASTGLFGGLQQVTLESIPIATGNDTSLIQSLSDVVSTYQCMSQYNDMKSFFSDASNIVGIKSAYAKYGLPPKNRPSVRHAFSWQDFCDWDKGILKFYYAAKYRNQYQIPVSDAINCEKISTMQIALNSEIANSDKLYVNDGDGGAHLSRTQALNDMLSDLNAMYANLSCDAAIKQQQQDAIAAQTAQEQAASQAALLQTYQATSTVSGGGSNIAIYAVAGVGVLITILVMVKLLKK